MILVDSSIWVCYYRPEGNDKIKKIIKEAIYSDLIAINGLVMIEILGGISHKENVTVHPLSLSLLSF